MLLCEVCIFKISMLQKSLNDILLIFVVIDAENNKNHRQIIFLHAMGYFYGYRELLPVAHGHLPSRDPFTNMD